MQRVLVLLDYNETGGTGVFAKRLISFLSDRYLVHVCLNKACTSTAFIEYLNGVGCEYSEDFLRLPAMDAFMNRLTRRLGIKIFYEYFRDGFISYKLIRRYRPEMIFISQGGGCRYFRFLLTAPPVVIITHSLFNESVHENMLGRKYVSLYRTLSGNNKRIVCVSKVADSLFRINIHCDHLAAISRHIGNFGQAMGRNEKARDSLTVLTLGHLVEYKNPKIWMETAIRLTRIYPGRFKFIWAGDGAGLREMKKLAEEYVDISFLGFQEHVAALYREADIYFQPSKSESQGIAVVEALSAGLPCVVSSAGGLPESIEDGVEGFVCEPSAVDQYVQAFLRLFENSELRVQLGINAREKYKKLFTRETWEAKMTALIKEIV